MKSLVFLCLLAFSFSLWSRTSDDDLTLKLAKERKSQIKSVSYILFFDLEKGIDTYKGTTTIHVELTHLRDALSIDSLVTNVESVKVNGKKLSKFPMRKGSFDIPANVLSPKMNIEIAFTNEYSKDGHGFKKVKDPEDGAEYSYTDFEPYHAHWLFPSFDQPDLKATYKVTVKAPADWRVIHNDIIKDEKKEGNYKVTTFNETKPFSTYLFFLGAGPYEEWTDKFGELPLTLYARKSMAKYVDEEQIFDTTKKGLAFYNEYFGHPYPFPKYGQIFVPEFAPGAMENPGAVTFNEQRFVFRGPVSQTTLEDRDNVILHEMAHMWFGDLVTMEWWNDLWLNESFATYAATLAQEKGLKTNFAAMDFLSTKTWGYWQDQLITTHPIEAVIPDVRSSKGIFDGITYAKGGSALKQLHFYVGEEGFKKGLQDYFKTYAWKNTERKDFIDSIAKASGKDLTGWTKKWLQTAGPNRVNMDFTCAQDKIKTAQIIQKPSVSGALSPHKTRFALYKKDKEELKFVESIDVSYEKSQTPVKELVGKSCPDFVLPNMDDHDYALFTLDSKSVELASLALQKLPDPLSRYSVWTILFQMVRDQKLNPKTFITSAFEALKVENDETLVGLLLGRHSTIRDQYLLYLSVEERAKVAADFENIIWQRVVTAKPKSSLQISFFDFFSNIAQTKESQERIFSMLEEDEAPKGIELDADRRWSLVRTLAVNGHPKARAVIASESKRDPSTLGKRLAYAAEVALPDLTTKKSAFKNLTESKLSFSDFREAADVFNNPNYPEISTQFIQDFFAKVSSIDWKSHDDLVDPYFERMFPIKLCTKEAEKVSSQKLKAAKNLTSIARKGWLEAHDELSRCVKVTRK